VSGRERALTERHRALDRDVTPVDVLGLDVVGDDSTLDGRSPPVQPLLECGADETDWPLEDCVFSLDSAFERCAVENHGNGDAGICEVHDAVDGTM
jgi:hypothetical protein